VLPARHPLPDQLRDHPLRGAIFATWVVSEVLKSRTQRGLPPNLTFFRDGKGAEVDLVIELGRKLLAIETKSGRTIASDFFSGLNNFAALVQTARVRRTVQGFLVYRGTDPQRRSKASVIPWSRLDTCKWWDREE
jgi:hypothetical protein